MNHETALSQAREIADRVLAPAAAQNDKEGRFSTEAVDILGRVGLLGLTLPTEFGGAGLGPRTFAALLSERLVPEGALTEIWTSAPYNHCMFTARPDLDPSLEQRFAEALSGMNYDNPRHRAVLDAEGLRHWEPLHLEGYESLRLASAQQGFFNRPIPPLTGA